MAHGYRKEKICIAALAASLFFSTPAFSEKDIDAQLAESQARRAELAKKSEALNSEVGKLKSKLVESSISHRKTEEKISQTDKKLKDLKEQESRATEGLYKAQKALGGLVTAAQRYSRTSMPDLLLESAPIDAARAALVMKSMIPELNRQSDELKSQLTDLKKIEDDILGQQALLEKELKEYNGQQSTLKKLVDQRQAVYARTESDRKAQELEVKRLAEKARNLEDLVSKIQTHTKTASSYKLPPNILLPVHGRIRVGFGETDDLGGRSKGVTFGVRAGATVVTPLAGKVKFAGPFQKYRQILIIEHRGGYHSLIAGLGRIDTVVGASLDAGEPVGAADDSASEARVYYELRLNGQPVNPQKLLAEQHKQDKS